MNRNAFLFVLPLIFLVSSPVFADPSSYDPAFYREYAQALSQFVDEDGLVDYERLKSHPEDLTAFLDKVDRLVPAEFETWPSADRMAFWINAYNACTLKAILDHYPIRSSFLASMRYPRNSIRQISGVWTELTFPVLGGSMTLDQIEHETLRKQFQEPRIHFAVNCASAGCPRLLNVPYQGDRLEEQFSAQIDHFMRDPKQFRVDPKKGFFVSQLLKWYGDDFVPSYGTGDRFIHLNNTERAVVNFFFPRLDETMQKMLETRKFDVKYLDYDWTLNDTKEKRTNP